MLNDDRNRIAHLEERLAEDPAPAGDSVADLEMLADLYMQADSYLPALETIERLLGVAAAGTLSAARRASLESKAVACRLAQGDCHAALAQCREVLRTETAIDNTSVRARLHLQCAEALFRLGRPEDTRVAAENGLAIADRGGDIALSAQALNLLGRAAYRTGHLDLARDHYEQSLALYRRIGDEASTAHIRNNLGLIHKNLCDWDTAAAHLRAALDIHRRHGRYAETANPLMNLGIVYQKSGEWRQALECYREAEQVYRRVSDHLRLTVVAIGKGNVARLERRFDDAETEFKAALEGGRSMSAAREEVLALEFMGELDFDRGRAESAIALYREALVRAERVAPDGDLVVEIERRRAEALCAVGRFDDAERACQRARRLAEQTKDRLEFAIAHRVAGEIAAARGRSGESRGYFEEAVRLLNDCRERFELGRTFLLMGRAAEDGQEARRHLYRASALFADLSTQYWLDVSETELERRSAVHSRSVAPAARRGGRPPSLVACSTSMRRVESLARRAASTELSVLITGETGTGKELVARTIHNLSVRARQPFLAVNCGALRADLALSQLFGHRKGAFTGAHAEGIGLVEAANGGTLFLDEVGELPADVQVTLLRFLESGEYLRLGETEVRRSNVRVIAATNRELRGREGEEAFRRDLMFRLNEIEIHVPPLRERAGDILPLARHFLAFYGGIDGPQLSPDAESVLHAHPWPGNVRELENVMKRVAALHADAGELTASLLLSLLEAPASSAPAANAPADERSAILSAYERAGHNKSRTAELLGVSRKTLYARLKRLELELP